MRKIIWAILILLCCFLFSSCATTSAEYKSSYGNIGSGPLDKWMEREAVPYLVKELGEHPMFKNQPFLLVSMNMDNVQPEIDDFTLQLREQIIDGLLTKQGVGLVWRPSIKPFTHHTRLANISCSQNQKIRYYIGLDTGLSKVDQKLYVKIRALNLDENKWVTGFGISWEGKASSRQKAALNNKHPDDFLLGLRPLPFSDSQADLLAAYLAHNLSCLFTQRDIDDVIVHVNQTNPENIDYFNNAFSLVKNYLAKFREVQVTDDPGQANISVAINLHAVHNGLYQVWATAKFREGDKYVPGAETEAYVFLNTAAIKTTSPVIKDTDVCFFDFTNGFEQQIYPLLKKAPGITGISRLYNKCSPGSVCLCYKLSSDPVQSENVMQDIMVFLANRFKTSNTGSHRMTPVSDHLLEIRFNRGFD